MIQGLGFGDFRVEGVASMVNGNSLRILGLYIYIVDVDFFNINVFGNANFICHIQIMFYIL